MNNETPKDRERNTLMELVMMACLEEIEASPEGQALHKAIAEFEDQLKDSPERNNSLEFFMLTGNLYTTYGEAMFKRGWELRGNPDLLVQLIEPE